MQIFTEGTIAFVLFVFSFGQFLSIYNHDQKVTSAFNIFLLLSIASLFVTEYIYLMPLFLLGMIILRSFSFKMFLASVIGLLVPYLITLSSFYFFDSMALIENIWSNHTIYRFAEWPSISNAVVLYGVFLLVMTLLSMVSLFMASMNFKVNVRLNFVFINWSFFLTLVLMFLFLNNLLLDR